MCNTQYHVCCAWLYCHLLLVTIWPAPWASVTAFFLFFFRPLLPLMPAAVTAFAWSCCCRLRAQYMGSANAMDGPQNLMMNIFCYAIVFAIIHAHPPLALKVKCISIALFSLV